LFTAGDLTDDGKKDRFTARRLTSSTHLT